MIAWLALVIVASAVLLAELLFGRSISLDAVYQLMESQSIVAGLSSLVLLGSVVKLWSDSKPDFWDAVESVPSELLTQVEEVVGWREEWLMVATMALWLLVLLVWAVAR
ncbi:hypothetical protein GCM10027030_22650 [Luteococcus sediminum]